MPKGPPLDGAKTMNPDKGRRDDLDIDLDGIGANTVKQPKNQPLLNEQKTKLYTNRLLLFKLQQHRLEIEPMLDKFVQNKLFYNIDCKRHFEEIIDAF